MCHDSVRLRWPILAAFGQHHVFQDALNFRERVNFDPEDAISELWVVLAEKNDKWESERGKYITFAGVIVDRELCAIRERSRTVRSPKDSSYRIKA